MLVLFDLLPHSTPCKIQYRERIQHVNKHLQNASIVLLLKVQINHPSVIRFGLVFVLTVLTAQK